MMKIHIPLISNIIKYFHVFWGYTGIKLFLFILISLLAVCTESLGIALFMPFLTKTNLTVESSDKVSLFFNELFDFFGMAPSIYVVCASIICIFILRSLIQFAAGLYAAKLIAVITQDVRGNMVGLFEKMNYRYYVDQNTGYFTNLVTIEANRMVASFSRYCAVLMCGISIAVYVGVSFWINWQFTVATLIFSCLVLYSFKSLSSVTKKYSIETSQEYSELHSMLIHSLQAFKYVKATFSFSTLQKKLLSTIGNLSGLQYKTQFAGNVMSALAEPLIIFFIVGFIVYQVALLKQSIAPLLVSIMFFYRVSQCILRLQGEWQLFSSFAGAVDSINTAARTIEAGIETGGTTRLKHFTSSITFKDVSFSYADKPVLQSISCRIDKNSTVAFVGESGVGKTTMVDLITGILVPQKGEILIDDIPLARIQQSDWRTKIGYVTQEPVLFNDSVAHNISFWACQETENDCCKRIQEAAREAHCVDFIRELPGTYQAVIGDRGIKLSAGQRQRLAIARELFKKPELLILDEATSALDGESENYIQQSIYELKGTITVVLIAHRLATIRNADYIYVFSDGRIIEEGTFQSLQALEGSRFRQMCELQNLQTS